MSEEKKHLFGRVSNEDLAFLKDFRFDRVDFQWVNICASASDVIIFGHGNVYNGKCSSIQQQKNCLFILCFTSSRHFFSANLMQFQLVSQLFACLSAHYGRHYSVYIRPVV